MVFLSPIFAGLSTIILDLSPIFCCLSPIILDLSPQVNFVTTKPAISPQPQTLKLPISRITTLFLPFPHISPTTELQIHATKARPLKKPVINRTAKKRPPHNLAGWPLKNCHSSGKHVYFVPNNRSPASPKPGTM